ncbi:MAG: DUF4252 domain-containing protein [Bacteroidota bacterium]
MTRYLLAALVALLPLVAPAAQPLDPSRLDSMFGTQPNIEVNLRGSLLRLAAEAARGEEPEAGLMLDGLRAVTVRVYPSGDNRDRFVSRMDGLGDELERDGWMTMVRIRNLPGDDEEEDVWVYVLDDGDVFDGLAVMMLDGEEENAIFVHIDGSIDPADVARLTSRFGNVDIDFGDDDYDNDDYGDDDDE